MTPIKTPNLELSLQGRIATMNVTGKMAADTLTESYDWLTEAAGETSTGEDSHALQLRVTLREENFDNLAEASAGFQQVGKVFRHVPALDKCAVVTDSAFLRNTAKVEGAVIPGMDLMTFAPEGVDAADSWLRGESLTETVPVDTAPESKASETDEDATTPEAAKDDTPSENPWDNLSMKKVKAAL